MKSFIESIIKNSLEKLDIDLSTNEVFFNVERPEDFKNGDYSTNVALILAKKIKTEPLVLAEKILAELMKHPLRLSATSPLAKGEGWGGGIENIQIAGAGFINFFLSKDFYINELKKINELASQYGFSNMYEGKKILVEHSSPNLFKPFHIGHVMNNAIGESITRLAKFSGADVVVVSFPSDISLGVAKAIFVILENLKDIKSFMPNITMLGDAYVEGVKKYEENDSIHIRVKEIADNLYAKKDSPELEVFEICKKFNMNYFENITKKLGSNFDSYIYESEAGVRGKEIVLENTPNVFTKSEGAIVYIPEETKKNINTAVFINSQGNPTYEAKDLGLLDIKFEKYNPDFSIFITDHQQISHFDVVLDSASKINSMWMDRVSKSIHRTHGRMTFKGQKMSSRLGGVPLAEDLLETIFEDVKEKSSDLSDNALLSVSVSAFKFTILRAMAGKNINFDPETSLSFEGGSGPYIQYTAVRAKSILSKTDINFDNLENKNSETLEIEKILVYFPEVVQNSINTWAPHHISTYLLQLAQSFNSWYGNTKIIDDKNINMPYNLFITKSVAQVLENGLWLLGITLPEKM